MVIIGITGSLATGKTTVASLFAENGSRVLNADIIAHRFMRKDEACYKPIIKNFSTAILTRGRIDHKKLAAIVFNDAYALKRLTKITHPLVIRHIRKKIKQFKKNKRNKAVVLDVPLLFESGLDAYVDVVIVVTAKKTQQIERIKKRLKISKSEALKRIKAQIPLTSKIRFADIIIDNSGNLNKTKRQVNLIWHDLT
jgi:dephospho-CoA kinase